MFFSSPDKFNDPYDCGLPFKQHPENSDPAIIKFKVKQTAPNIYPHLAHDRIALEEICAKQVMLILQNPDNWFEMNWSCRPEDLNKLFGVLSLTPHFDNYLIWSHYANSHKGFCVEFDTRLLVESVKGHYQQVNYSKEIPYFSIMDLLNQEIITKLIYTKSVDWIYEDEYRITAIHRPNTPVNFNPKALTAIYFGYKMMMEQKIEIIDKVKVEYPWIKFYNMELDKENFRLIKGELPIL
jgi:hypothetical protein